MVEAQLWALDRTAEHLKVSSDWLKEKARSREVPALSIGDGRSYLFNPARVTAALSRMEERDVEVNTAGLATFIALNILTDEELTPREMAVMILDYLA